MVHGLRLRDPGQGAPRRAGRQAPALVGGKDIVLKLLEKWGAKQSQGMSVEFVDARRQLPIAYRNTIANMMAEAEAQNGIFAPDEITYAWYREKGIGDLPYPPIAPGADAVYEIDEALDLSACVPMIREALQPRQRVPRRGGRARAFSFDKASSARAPNGSYDDLLSAALVDPGPRRRRDARTAAQGVRRLPRLGRREAQIEKPEPRPRRRVDRRSPPGAGARSAIRGAARASARAPTRSPGPARDHVVQSQLAEPHGPRWRGVPRVTRGRRRVRARGLHGAAVGAGLSWKVEEFGI
jgi:hypothetical protein